MRHPNARQMDIIGRIADVLAVGNPRFDRARFLEACETGKCKGMQAEGPSAADLRILGRDAAERAASIAPSCKGMR